MWAHLVVEPNYLAPILTGPRVHPTPAVETPTPQHVPAAPMVKTTPAPPAFRHILMFIRPAPVPGVEGTRSFARPEFDPLWEKVGDADGAVGMHTSDDGTTEYMNQWEGRHSGE